MPQIKGKHMKAFLSYLKNLGVAVQERSVPVKDLKATQKEILPKLVNEVLEDGFHKRSQDRPVLASQDNYILDGHHRWAAWLIEDPTVRMKLIQIMAPIQRVLELARNFPDVKYSVRPAAQRLRRARARRLSDRHQRLAGDLMPRPSPQRVVARYIERQADASHVEHSFVMFKPLAVKKGMTEQLKGILEKHSGGAFEQCKPVTVSGTHMAKHYKEHQGKPFFSILVDYYNGKKVIACRIGGPRGTINAIRRKLGPSNPVDCTVEEHIRAMAIEFTPEKGTGETCGVDNLVHASDSKSSARRELLLWGLPVTRAGSQKEDHFPNVDTTRISKVMGSDWRRVLTSWVDLSVAPRLDSYRDRLAASLGQQVILALQDSGVEATGIEVQKASPQGARTVFFLPDRSGIMSMFLSPGERGAWTAKSAGTKGKFLGDDNLEEVVRNLIHHSR